MLRRTFMKTQIKKTNGQYIVTIDGFITYESHDHFKEEMQWLTEELKDSTPKNILFNLENLEFVGSSGITNFLATLKEFNLNAPIKPSYISMKSEFQKMIRAFEGDEYFDFYENEDQKKSMDC